MRLSVFWKSLLFGPMLSALTFQFSMHFSDATLTHQSFGDYISMFALLCVGGYILVFVPVEGLPGIVPLVLYASLFAFLIDPLLGIMFKNKIKNHFKVTLITFLSVFIGVIVYSVFFFFSTPHKEGVQQLLVFMVVPTSIVFGIWFGVSCVRRYP